MGRKSKETFLQRRYTDGQQAPWLVPWWLSGKEFAWNAGDMGLIPGSGRSPGRGNGNPLLYSCLRIPWREEPGRLQSMGSQRVGHSWVTSLSLFTFRYADDTTLMAESEELKSLLMKVKEERGKSWLKAQHWENKDHGIWTHHFMANRRGNSRNSNRLYFEGAPKSLQMVTTAMKLKNAYSLGEKE